MNERTIYMKQLSVRDCLHVEEFPAYMDGWCKKKPGYVTVSTIGKSGGYDILKAVFTDPNVSDEDKQVVLLTAQHALELSGINSLLSVGNYLVSDAPDAGEMLQKLIIVMIPCSNPYTYAKQDDAYAGKNEAGIDEYVAFDFNGISFDAETAPAAHAIKQTLDFYKPDLMMDVHGVIYQNQMVVESLGFSGNPTQRFYNNEFVCQVQQAGTDAGHAMKSLDSLEVLLQTCLECTDEEINSRFLVQKGRPAQASLYSYYHYHTLGGTFETGWEGSVVPQILEALRIGCRTWHGEYYAGYPTRTVVGPGINHSLRAYGNTASMRRKSRIELWKNRDKIGFGLGHPEMPGLESVFIYTDPNVAENVAAYYEPMNDVIAKMAQMCDIDAERMLKMLDAHYPQHVGYCRNANGDALQIEHGMTVRVGLPFADARNFTVLYNGYEKQEDELDGYTVTKDANWVYIDLHIPADKISPFAIAMVKYDCTIPQAGIMEF
ncbi:MAG: hypothetical protein E7418_03320 [Ruminococcaceae bacterium]|nr:hypothetical protein [Oscillospiraceae bacterium]